MSELKRKVALVTGAGKDARGIGQAIALELARRGAQVAVASRTEDNARRAAESVNESGGTAMAVAMDVCDASSVDTGVKQIVSAWGSLDILVNNAGITRDGLLMRMSESDWDAVVDTSLKGAFLCIKSVSRQMIKQRSGSIINVGSIMGLIGNAGQANYSAAKAGLIGLTKAAARELGSRSIRVNLVAPGWIETAMTDALGEEVRAHMLQQIPLGRLGCGEDVARVVAFLASDDSAYVTGQVLTVDGGLVMM